ncbi:MAG: class I SAM-dependent methyltransferase [Candidatus Berkiella sp.]
MKVVGNNSLKILSCLMLVLFSSLITSLAKANSEDRYFQSIMHAPPEEFVVMGLSKIPGNGTNKVALDLGSSIGRETKLLLQKGYHVIAVDNNARALQFMKSQSGISKYKSNLKTVNASFENLDFKKLPKSDLVISSFALPFVPKSQFNRVWQELTASIKPGGHIIVNLFDPIYQFYSNNNEMTFHTKSQAQALFHNFTIIEFKAMRSDPLKPGSKNHYYVIVAKKL